MYKQKNKQTLLVKGKFSQPQKNSFRKECNATFSQLRKFQYTDLSSNQQTRKLHTYHVC